MSAKRRIRDKAERDAAYRRGLERAAEIAARFWYERDDFDRAIQAEIDKGK